MSVWDDIPWSRRRAAEIREQVTDEGERFGSGDDPIASQSPMVQRSLVQNLRNLMVRQTEGADQTTAGLRGEFTEVEIDPTVSYGEMVERIKQTGDGTGFESDERDERAVRRERAAQEARNSAVEYLVDECMRLEEEAGVDGVESLQAAGDGRAPAVPGGEQLRDDVEDMIAEFDFQVVTEAMARCEEMSRPDREIDQGASGIDEEQLLDRVQSILGQRPASVDDAFARIEDRLESEREDTRENILNRLSFAFSSNFESVDEAVDSLRDRIDTLRQLDVRTGEITLRGNRDAPPSVSVEIGFGEFESRVREQVDRAIDRDALSDLPRTFEKRIGSVRVARDEIQLIDLTPLQLDSRLTMAVVDSDELLRRFEIEADVAAPPAPEVTDPPTPPEPGAPEEEPDPPDVTPTPDPVEPTPEEPDPDPEPEFDQLADDRRGIVERAVDAGDLLSLAETFGTGDLFELAAAIERGAVPDPALDTLTDYFTSASSGERSRARQRQDGVGEVQRQLERVPDPDLVDPTGIEFDPDPDLDLGDDPDIEDLIDEAEPDRPDVADFSDRDPEGRGNRSDMTPEDFIAGISDLFDDTDRIPTQRGTDRPDPFASGIEDQIAPLLRNRIAKAQAWVAAEQERLDRGVDDPGTFWDTFGSNIWGGVLSRDEFVGLSV